MILGLVGKELIHSYSKEIHEAITPDKYALMSLSEEELVSFLEKRNFQGVNVTIPYKQTVIPYLDEIDLNAKKIGAVNTIVNNNGIIKGYNTDYIGFKTLLDRHNITIKGKRCLILGSGGTSKMIFNVLKDLDAFIIAVASRNPQKKMISYDDLHHQYFDIIINATPVGMYPNDNVSPLDISIMKNVETVIDVIYNPVRTRLMLDALSLGIKTYGGLRMLVEQAFYSHELFFNTKYDELIKEEIMNKIFYSKLNIALIGMPASGKTSIATLLGKRLSKKVFDTDETIINIEGKSINDIFLNQGEEKFRQMETKVIECIDNSGIIVATGGGIVKNEANMISLKSKCLVFYIKRDKDNIILSNDRPLCSNMEKWQSLQNERDNLYNKYADYIIDNNSTLEKAVEEIIKNYNEYIKEE